MYHSGKNSGHVNLKGALQLKIVGHYDFWSQSHQLDGYFNAFILGCSALRKAEGAEPSAGARNCKPAHSAGLDS